MPLPLELAHRRYLQQASWTQPLRRHLLRQAGLPNALRVLEIGCGTGAILANLGHARSTSLFGLDIDRPALQLARQHAPASRLSAGDALHLPYTDGAFDISLFHFVLLWLPDPVAALRESRRVTRLGGAVLALAEPDYTRRIDEPTSLTELGRLQTQALRTQGADPQLGGKLDELFLAAGLTVIESGQMLRREDSQSQEDAALEWEVLRSDLQGTVPEAELDRLSAEDLGARQSGKRVLFVPTMYAWGKVGN